MCPSRLPASAPDCREAHRLGQCPVGAARVHAGGGGAGGQRRHPSGLRRVRGACRGLRRLRAGRCMADGRLRGGGMQQGELAGDRGPEPAAHARKR